MKFTGRQFVMFSSLYLSYTLYIYVRRSFSYAIPAIASKEKLDKSQFGLITSSQSIAYTISKFVSGILVDFVSPRLLLAGGLICSGATAFVFTGFKSVTVLSGIWFLNGLSQGPGWPAAAVILRQWVPPEVFGTAWSILSTSMNVAGTLGPLVTAYIINHTGWQYCMQLAGSISITFGFISVILIKNKSKDPNEDSNSTKREEKTSTDNNKKDKGDTNEKDKGDNNEKDKEEKKKGVLPVKEKKKMTRMELLKIEGYIGICMSYLVTTLVQFSMIQWAQLYIVHERKQSLLLGSGYISSLEVGGIIGSFVAGFLSDSLIIKNPELPRHLIRQVIVTYFLIALTATVYIFTFYITEHSSRVFITGIGFLNGVCIYGPISIAGVIAMEIAPDHMAGTSHALAGLFSNVGMMLAGFPLTCVAKLYDWQTTFLLLGTVVLVTVISLVFKIKRELNAYPAEKYRKLIFLS